MIRSVIAATVILGGITALLAQSDPITDRQALMKSNAKNAKNMTQMVKGEAPFDAAQAKAAFNTWHENAKRIPTLFPSPPPADAKTRALPKIWQNKADFEAKAAALAKAASEGKTGTLDELKASFPNVQKACGDCHDNYRQPAPPAEGKK
jgi:cytochrome c556